MKTFIISQSTTAGNDQPDLIPSQQKDAPVQETEAKRVKKLTSADMWNLQKNSRSASDLFRKWDLN